MTRPIRFVDAFWGTDFCSTAGMDALIKRGKESKQQLRDYVRFLRERAKAEESYGKALASLAKNAECRAENGTLRNSWNQIKESTEAIGQEHLDAARALSEAADRVSAFTEGQKEARKKEEDLVKKSSSTKRDLYKRCTDSRKSYVTKSADAEMLEAQVQSVKDAMNPGMQTKEMEKLFQRQQKSVQDARKADQAYHQILDQLDQARVTWEKDMTNFCEFSENLEEQFLQFLRNEFWILANISSVTYVDNDKHCESIRKMLEKCNVDQDIMLFINEYHTGKELPAPVRYEPYTTVSRKDFTYDSGFRSFLTRNSPYNK